ncbi:hypothetical protein [Bradyrhizobium stylosanthis]|uniref:hypothetical protein n=1 Tax=Bradyrhizobium stylosanthis TaxID=1803665 RepID=UPI0007C54F90|nr:hypothetical protein [Bradyrhizobium stylosanthis]
MLLYSVPIIDSSEGSTTSNISTPTFFGSACEIASIDLDRFTEAFDRTLYACRNLSRGVLNKENSGEDKPATGDPFCIQGDDQLPNRLNACRLKAFIAGFPLAEADKAALVAFRKAPIDYLKGLAFDAKESGLARTSDRECLISTTACARGPA